ncbi:MAG: hypothetical protein KAX78_05975 [Phycisphaerae bacterium]|nr:hypothetical protein [Phycisphaerae bacterium]
MVLGLIDGILLSGVLLVGVFGALGCRLAGGLCGGVGGWLVLVDDEAVDEEPAGEGQDEDDDNGYGDASGPSAADERRAAGRPRRVMSW